MPESIDRSTVARAETAADRLALARQAFQDYYARCFWSLRQDLDVREEHLPQIIEGLRRHGGHSGFLLAPRLCR